MADSRIEQVMDALVTTLTGLATTGSNVTRFRFYPDAAGDLPSLNIVQSDVVPVDDMEPEALISHIDWRLTARVEATVQSSAATDQTLNAIHKEVFAAVMADRTLGLSFVAHTWPGPVLEPEGDSEAKKKTARLDIEWNIHLRTSRTALDA